MKTKVRVSLPVEAGIDAETDAISGDVSPTAAASALFLSFAFLMVGMGLQGAVLGVRVEQEGFRSLWTGLIMTAYFAGLLIGARLTVKSLAQVGHIRVFAALASTASAAVLIHAVVIVPPVWVAMRFLTGLCAAGLYVVAESWLNDISTNKTRGRLLAIYMVISMGGFAVGNLLLDTADTRGVGLFVVSSVLVSLSLVPVALSTNSAPTIRLPDPMGIIKLVKLVPTGVITSFAVGSAHGALIGMGAVYATREGLDPGQVAVFMGVPMIGSVITQYPLGMLSDHTSRRGLMATIALIAAGSSAVLSQLEPGTLPVIALMFVVGGTTFPLYSLAIAYTNDWLEPAQITSASSTLVSVTGLGAMAGPFMVIGAISLFGNSGFFWVMALTHGIVGAHIMWRIAFGNSAPKDRPGLWTPLSVRSTVVLASLARPVKDLIGR